LFDLDLHAASFRPRARAGVGAGLGADGVCGAAVRSGTSIGVMSRLSLSQAACCDETRGADGPYERGVIKRRN